MSDRQLVAQDLAYDVFQAEMAVDAAIAAVGGLVGRLPAYRAEAGLSAVAGHEVFANMSQATVFLSSARGEIVHGHNRLDTLRRLMKLNPVTALGPVDKPGQNVVPELA